MRYFSLGSLLCLLTVTRVMPTHIKRLQSQLIIMVHAFLGSKKSILLKVERNTPKAHWFLVTYLGHERPYNYLLIFASDFSKNIVARNLLPYQHKKKKNCTVSCSYA